MGLFGFRGVFLPEMGRTEKSETISIAAPERLRVPLRQGDCEPCQAAVKPGDRVLMGQCVGRGEVPVHSPVSGRAAEVTEDFVTVENDGELTPDPSVKPPVISDRNSFIEAVKASGCVGLGGAGHATYKKLADFKGDTLVANGMECEPFLNSDLRCLTEQAEDVLAGAAAVMEHLGIEKCILAVNGSNEELSDRLEELCRGKEGVTLKKLAGKYPVGKDTILAPRLGVKNALVLNVSTLAFIAEYLRTGMPLISRRVTVDGDVVRTPCVVKAPVGTPLSVLLSFAEANMEAADKLVMGGAMMGKTVTDPELPIEKTTAGVLAFMRPLTNKKGIVDGAGETGCLRCGRCMDSCPAGLMPMRIASVFEKRPGPGRTRALKRLRPELCLGCGACTFVCPAKRSPGEAVEKAAREVSADE